MNSSTNSRTNRPPQPPVSRHREKRVIEEEAGAELKLGEFQNSSAITISESRALMQMIFEDRTKKGKFKVPDNDVITKTQEYVEIFSRFKNQESVKAVDMLLHSEHDLQPYEKAQLGTLCCDTAEEAKTLIPSLENKKTDEELQDLLNQITRLRNFVE